MGKGEFTFHAIRRHQQPSCQTFLDLAASVGKSRSRGLHHKRVRVTQHDLMQADTRADGVTQIASRHPLSGACDLDVGFVDRFLIAAHHDRQAAHAFSPDDADLDVADAIGDNGSNPLSGK